MPHENIQSTCLESLEYAEELEALGEVEGKVEPRGALSPMIEKHPGI